MGVSLNSQFIQELGESHTSSVYLNQDLHFVESKGFVGVLRRIAIWIQDFLASYTGWDTYNLSVAKRVHEFVAAQGFEVDQGVAKQLRRLGVHLARITPQDAAAIRREFESILERLVVGNPDMLSAGLDDLGGHSSENVHEAIQIIDTALAVGDPKTIQGVRDALKRLMLRDPLYEHEPELERALKNCEKVIKEYNDIVVGRVLLKMGLPGELREQWTLSGRVSTPKEIEKKAQIWILRGNRVALEKILGAECTSEEQLAPFVRVLVESTLASGRLLGVKELKDFARSIRQATSIARLRYLQHIAGPLFASAVGYNSIHMLNPGRILSGLAFIPREKLGILIQEVERYQAVHAKRDSIAKKVRGDIAFYDNGHRIGAAEEAAGSTAVKYAKFAANYEEGQRVPLSGNFEQAAQYRVGRKEEIDAKIARNKEWLEQLEILFKPEFLHAMLNQLIGENWRELIDQGVSLPSYEEMGNRAYQLIEAQLPPGVDKGTDNYFSHVLKSMLESIHVIRSVFPKEEAHEVLTEIFNYYSHQLDCDALETRGPVWVLQHSLKVTQENAEKFAKFPIVAKLAIRKNCYDPTA